MLTIVCWKWKKHRSGFQLPGVAPYTAHHVNVLRNMLERHCHIPFRFVCLTDDSRNVQCETLPIPTQYAELGGCYRRLWMFSEEARELLGERIAAIDLDCVIVKDCTEIFSRSEDFIINAYNPCRKMERDQHYNGGLMMLDAGSRSELWDDFDPIATPLMLEDNRKNGVCIGSDQAWIRMRLGKKEARFTNADGIYEARQIKFGLPKNASIIFFSGRRDPMCDRRGWVRKNWK